MKMTSWLNANPKIHNTFASLTTRNEHCLTAISPECLEILDEINRELVTEDCHLRTFRRAIGFSQNVPKDLIPLLIHAKENRNNVANSARIVDSTVRLLVNLTVPIEYLLPIEMMRGSDVGKHSIFELTSLLNSSKKAFTDTRSTKAVTDHIRQIIETMDEKLTIEQCDSINNCLLLLRNILHIPENGCSNSTLQNQIVWNLFTQSIDKIIIFLITSPQKLFWSVALVQLITMLYKDQHVGTLQKLLNQWLEASLSESSEDNESNTSAAAQCQGGGSGHSSSLNTTSDSSDNGGIQEPETNLIEPTRTSLQTSRSLKGICEIKRVQSTETEASTSSGVSSMISSKNNSKSSLSETSYKKRNSISEISDCGYGTQVENVREQVSTSSNDDDQPTQKFVHQKPHSFQKTRCKKPLTTPLEKKDLRRKKLVKRSKYNTIKMKGLIHHLPTDDDISNVLKEFTVDFLLKGYGTLVQDLHAHFLSSVYAQIDTSHFFWLITYFLKFATQLELDLEHLVPVLSYDLLSYLVFQSVWILEEFEVTSRTSCTDLKPCLRRLHLAVTAIREYLQAVESYQKMVHLSDEDRDYLSKLQSEIVETDELGMLFLLLLNHYNSQLQTKQYLQDLVLTNHNYLLFLDNVHKNSTTLFTCPNNEFNLMEHLKKFANADIIQKYGFLLENYEENGEFINNCIFTMLHHIGGDLGNVSILFQPIIIKTFSQMWEKDFDLCDDWSDLIEYVIHKFINTSKPAEKLSEMENGSGSNCDEFQKETKSQLSIMNEMLNKIQNIFNDETPDFRERSLATEEELIEALKMNRKNDVNGKSCLKWLQQVLLDFCHVKLFLENFSCNENKAKLNPTIYHHSLLNLPVPLVPYSFDQENFMKFPGFINLLHKLGLYLPCNTGKIFVRIPNFWNAEFIYNIAKQIGTIDKSKLKFNADLLSSETQSSSSFHEINEEKMSLDLITIDPEKFSISTKIPASIRYTPIPNSSEWSQGWLTSDDHTIHRHEINATNQLHIEIPEDNILPPSSNQCFELALVPKPSKHHRKFQWDIMDYCSGTSVQDFDEHRSDTVASDLTRMCVSDEDDKTVSFPINVED